MDRWKHIAHNAHGGGAQYATYALQSQFFVEQTRSSEASLYIMTAQATTLRFFDDFWNQAILYVCARNSSSTSSPEKWYPALESVPPSSQSCRRVSWWRHRWHYSTYASWSPWDHHQPPVVMRNVVWLENWTFFDSGPARGAHFVWWPSEIRCWNYRYSWDTRCRACFAQPNSFEILREIAYKYGKGWRDLSHISTAWGSSLSFLQSPPRRLENGVCC